MCTDLITELVCGHSNTSPSPCHRFFYIRNKCQHNQQICQGRKNARCNTCQPQSRFKYTVVEFCRALRAVGREQMRLLSEMHPTEHIKAFIVREALERERAENDGLWFLLWNEEPLRYAQVYYLYVTNLTTSDFDDAV